MFGRCISFIGQGIHILYAQELFGIQCHGRKRMGVVDGACIVIDKEFVFGIAPGLNVVADVYDVTM